VTLTTDPVTQQRLMAAAEAEGFNLRAYENGHVGITLDERSTVEELLNLLRTFGIDEDAASLECAAAATSYRPVLTLERSSTYLTSRVFHDYRSETALLRYITSLQSRDLSLAQSMIPSAAVR
jgi:glycine dehydrogenase